jgi:hypothetical protein
MLKKFKQEGSKALVNILDYQLRFFPMTNQDRKTVLNAHRASLGVEKPKGITLP